MTVCEKIDAALQERGMSRRKLAIRAGISPSTLQCALNRGGTISLDMLVPISKVLNLSFEGVEVGTLYANDSVEKVIGVVLSHAHVDRIVSRIVFEYCQDEQNMKRILRIVTDQIINKL